MGRTKRGKSTKSQHAPHKNGPRAAKKNAIPVVVTYISKKNRKKQPKQLDKPKQSKQPKRPEQPKQPERLERSNPESDRAHLKAFFGKYDSFNYDSSKPVMDEFYRMCDWFGWERDNKERDRARNTFKNAMVQEFNSIYGTDHNSLEAWQSLCRVINLADIPDDLEDCREQVRSTHVNIVDLVDAPISRTPITHFSSEEALSAYTRTTGKYFPKENAYAGGLLRYLLRHIDNPGASLRRR